ncbi:MAG: c-type cytochrome [Gammaproteobacteria bacterium]|nr:c-type cytochrome [Gammaproteobacteria bacterium]
MKHTILMLVGVLSLAGCANDATERPRHDASTQVAGDSAVLDGERTYNEHCADCHETGVLGAPVAGSQQDWADRSQLWDAVLFDHAITGYLEMPAKGSRMDLPDDVVKAAAEYMLRLTFPDRPQDCNPPVCGDIDN